VPAEAMALLFDVRPEIKRKMFVNFVSEEIYHNLSVLQTRSAPIGVEVSMETTKNLIFH
jgi:glycine cleavage system pyridoxal-binding protein P